MMQFLIKTEIKTENDIVWVRRKARELGEYLKLDKQEQTRLATAVSEIARNTFQYAGRGMAEFNLEPVNEKILLNITITDKGPGIKNLKEILAGTYVSPEGMGVGLIGSKKLVDDLQIQSSPSGTTITLKKIVPLRNSLLSTIEIKKLHDSFMNQTSSDPIEEIQKQNHEMLLTLAALNEKKEELFRLNKELEDTNRGVVALYAELDEKAESLRLANESKAAFLSDMTHEFRSPLNSILSISDILLEEAKDEKNKEREKQVNFIVKAAQGLSDLVNDLLDIAKIEAGKIALRTTTFSVNEIFGTMRGLMRPLALNHTSVQLNIMDMSDDMILETDEGKLSQMLRNLISNAIKYTEAGEITISAKSLDNDLIEFKVTDTGIGIAEEDLERVFFEFFQVNHPLQKRVKGTGLGLPLTKRLAGLLGGTIEVESVLGKGSAFKIIIPVKYQGPSEKNYHGKSDKDLGEIQLRKVLVIDDEEFHRNQIQEFLKSKKISVKTANDGEDGLVLAKDWKPDLIILDLVMPNLDGFEFIREHMKEPSIKNIPIVLNTSKDLMTEELQYLEEVCYKVISKDSRNLISLENIINTLLANRKDSK